MLCNNFDVTFCHPNSDFDLFDLFGLFGLFSLWSVSIRSSKTNSMAAGKPMLKAGMADSFGFIAMTPWVAKAGRK